MWSSRHRLLNRTAAHGVITDCYRSIHVSLLQTDIQVQIAAPRLCEAKHTGTREGIAPSINYHEVGGGGDEEERRSGGLAGPRLKVRGVGLHAA